MTALPLPPPLNPSPRASRAPRATLRRRILGVVGALVILSLLGSSASLYRITEVSRSLDLINRIAVPESRLLVQIQADGEVFKRELDRRLGQSHWSDAHWKARPIPRWVGEVLRGEFERLDALMAAGEGRDAERARWRDWQRETGTRFQGLMDDSDKLFTLIERGVDAANEPQATEIYLRLMTVSEEWLGQLEWAVNEHDRAVRQAFSNADSKVAALRLGLEAILVVVVSLSLLLLWLGERALRPLDELTRLARQIAQRGVRREDKAAFPEIPMGREDEVSDLAREFHAMATALLEREKTVEAQKGRLQDQNRLLWEMGALNESVLRSIRSILIVTNIDGLIKQCNPVAENWLGAESRRLIGTSVSAWPKLVAALGQSADSAFVGASESRSSAANQGVSVANQSASAASQGASAASQGVSAANQGVSANQAASANQPIRVDLQSIGERIFGGSILPLKSGEGRTGWIIDLVDMTEDLALQERLRRAESLAAVGRMSAQVAHEIRNPLHSIGLEADLAAEMAAKAGHVPMKQSLASILASVDRLEKITENYLKLSRLSAGQKSVVDLGEVLETVLATYTSVCESKGVQVDWHRETHSDLRVYGDADLLEQMLGNLLSNAIQALEGTKSPSVSWRLGSLESGRVWLHVEDNGPGIAPEIRSKLFTPFVTTRAQGTGLGLSFVKKVTDEHGGEITCRESKSGRGACFELILPSVSSVAQGLEPQGYQSESGVSSQEIHS